MKEAKMAKIYSTKLQSILIILLAIIFTIGLVFISIELPGRVDRLLGQNIDFPDLATGQNEVTNYRTEVFLSHFHIRTIGYICFGLVLILIITGFIMEKMKLASAGAILLFLPVFGHFAATMFFLGGLAFLRFLWLPFLDISFDLMKLGDIVKLPYNWIVGLFSWFGLNISAILPIILIGIGLLIFIAGVFSWIYGGLHKKDVDNFWIYRLSRHPQYLGWIIWSYGILFLAGPNIKQYVTIPNTLPWLLSTMIIIGIAWLEEIKMVGKAGEKYREYREKTPFMFPIPGFIKNIILMPIRLIFGAPYPRSKPAIAFLITFYTILLMFLSSISAGIIKLPNIPVNNQRNIQNLTHIIRTTDNRNQIRHSANALAKAGDDGIDSLIILLNDKNVFVRWYCTDALGEVKSDRVIDPLAKLLKDSSINVRKAAANSLGGTTGKAIPILLQVLKGEDEILRSDAARSLGRLKAADAVPALINGLKSENAAITKWCSWALGEIGDRQALPGLINCLQNKNYCDFLITGQALQKLGSNKSEDAFIMGLESPRWWIQTSCAYELGKSPSKKGGQALIKALEIGEPRLRRAAVLSLSNFSGKQAQNALQNALQDPDWEVRLYARSALKNPITNQ